MNNLKIIETKNNLISFRIRVDPPMSSNSENIIFEIQTDAGKVLESSDMINNLLISPDDEQSDIYFPTTDTLHLNIVNVDIAYQTTSGLKSHYIDSGNDNENPKEYATPQNTQMLPLITWDTDSIHRDENYLLAVDNNSMFVHELDHSDLTSILIEKDLSINDEILKMFHYKNQLWLSSKANFRKILVDKYDNPELDIFSLDETIDNNSFDLISFVDDFIWATNSYLGIVKKISKNSFEVISEYSGFDAPVNIIYSKYHKDYIVVGNHSLWILNNGNPIRKQYAAGQTVLDFAISDNGNVAIIFRKDDLINIRVIDSSFEKILFMENVNNSESAKCIAVNDNFYFVIEKQSNASESYKAEHYYFDTELKSVKTLTSDNRIARPPSHVDVTPPLKKAEIIFPVSGSWIQAGTETEILWKSTESASSNIKIDLLRDGEFFYNIAGSVPNTGVHIWDVRSDIADGETYQIRIEWISPTPSSENIDISSFFIISSMTQPDIEFEAPLSKLAGIIYNREHVFNIMNNGLIGAYDIIANEFKGLFETGLSNINHVIDNSIYIPDFSETDAFRIFVGSSIGSNNYWDSGIIESGKRSIYYGGKDLINGSVYYGHLQIRNTDGEWSNVQHFEINVPS